MTTKPPSQASGPRSHWTDGIQLPRFGRVSRSLDVDAVVIGTGITGTTAAHLLRQAGAKVALIDRGRVGGVDTKSTTAHLTHVIDLRPSDLVKQLGKEQARMVWEAGQAAIDQIDETRRSLAIDCDFQWVPGFLHQPLDQDDDKEIRRLENDARLSTELGFPATTGATGPFGVGIRFPHQAAFHPLKYIAGLLDRIAGPDCEIFERSAVTEVTADPLTVHVGRHAIRCRFLVLATHTPLTGTTGLLKSMLFQTKLALYTSYAVGAPLDDAAIPDGLWWDTDDPYRYLRITRSSDRRYAILGGGDQKTGQGKDARECYRELSDYLRRLLPGARIDRRWSGQVIETNDGLPFIGETAPNQYAATGFSGNGMTFGTLGAMMARDHFLGRDNPWKELFDPKRKKLRGGTVSYLRENRDFPYYFLRDRLARAEATSTRSVRRNEGKIISLEGKKVAAFRDADGKLTLLSPVCTHLGCIVNWNDAEKTWDCPCHGSRFDSVGKVLSGPAETPLEPAPTSADH